MSGLAGILQLDGQPVQESVLQQTVEWLKLRGPDGQELTIAQPCGLVHCRLHITDLAADHRTVHLPADDRHGALTLVFNGEIYNHHALRKKLERRGHRFSSGHCDTEVLLHGYRQFGEQLPKHLHGMFAFAIWDAAAQSLFLARDRVGKKPLFFYQDAHRFAFAGLIGALFPLIGHTPSVDRETVGTYLTLGYTGRQTMLQGIEELPPASWLWIDCHGQSRTGSYWQPPPLSRSTTRLGVGEGIEELLSEAVACRLEAEAPLGCLLSGGLDSSLIAAIATRQMDQPLHTYTVSMPSLGYDEQDHALTVARHLGAKHCHLLAEADPIRDMLQLTAMLGAPIGNSSMLPVLWISRAVAPHARAVLAGTGAATLFGGHQRYVGLRMIQRRQWALKRIPIRWLGKDQGLAGGSRLRQLAYAAHHDHPARQYLSMIRLLSQQQIHELGFHDFHPMMHPPGWHREEDPAESARRWDLFNHLPYHQLRQVDQASMRCGLEVRCPMLDTQLLNLAGHVPLKVLMPRGQTKATLREVARRWLPASICRRPPYHLQPPIQHWLSRSLAGDCRHYLLDNPALTALGFNPETLRRWLDEHRQGRHDHARTLFTLMAFSIWLSWVHTPTPEPKTFSQDTHPGSATKY